MLSVLALADQVDQVLYDHFDRNRWRHIDLILSCGDLPPDYLDFLCSSLDVPVLYVRGNHDDQFPAERYDGCENVHGRMVQCKGIRIAGFEGSRRYNEGKCQYSEREMQRLVRRSRLRAVGLGRPHIVVAHAPPRGCHDAPDLCHQGFESFNGAIRAWQPAFFVHGHTHSYNGHQPVTRIGETTVINAYPYHEFQLADASLHGAGRKKPGRSGDRPG